jgi:hypothetical protein
MKTYITLIATLLVLCNIVSAEDHLVSTALRVQQGEDLLTAPTVIAKSNHNFKVEVTKPFIQAEGLSLDTGVSLDGKTEQKKDKISYSFILTLRELDENKGTSEQKTTSFKTREFLLSGEATPGKEFKIDLGNGTMATLTLSSVKPEENKKS